MNPPAEVVSTKGEAGIETGSQVAHAAEGLRLGLHLRLDSPHTMMVDQAWGSMRMWPDETTFMVCA